MVKQCLHLLLGIIASTTPDSCCFPTAVQHGLTAIKDCKCRITRELYLQFLLKQDNTVHPLYSGPSLQWNLSIVDTTGTQLAVLYREISII